MKDLARSLMVFIEKYGINVRLNRYGRRFGFDVRKAWRHPNLIEFMQDRKIDVAFDVGANVGQFGLNLRRGGWRGLIISFEPVREAFEKLRDFAKADKNWQVHNIALGPAPGRVKINVASATMLSSVLPASDGAATFHAGIKTVRVDEVEMSTLDEIAAGLGERPLVKVDVQGFERDVLEGSAATLSRASGVLLELPIINLYDNSWNFESSLSYMAERGFLPTQLDPVNYHKVDRQALIEVDCLFRPRNKCVDNQ